LIPFALTLIVSLAILFPIVWLVLSSFKETGELFSYPLAMFPSRFTFIITKRSLVKAFSAYVFNSHFLAVVGTAITLVISAMCGYALAIYRQKSPIQFGVRHLLLGVP
jgi:alpha-1,4-digalacturonate transport system permease protein